MSSIYTGLFITDLDGTLLTDGKCISEQDGKSLSRLKGERVATVAATGRSLFSVKRLFSGLTAIEHGVFANIDYLIFSTGAGVMDCATGEIIRRHSLTPGEARSIAEQLHHREIDHMVHAPIPNTEYFLYSCYNDDNADFHHRINLYKEFGQPMNKRSWGEMDKYDGATEVLAILDGKDAEPMVGELKNDLSEFSVIRATSPLDHKSTWVEVFAPNVSKANAADWLCARLNIQRNQTCCIGNDYNDEDMLAWSASSYVVKNSPKLLMNSYRSVASNNNSGVSEAIEDWMNTN